jgi:hypothetical protein
MATGQTECVLFQSFRVCGVVVAAQMTPGVQPWCHNTLATWCPDLRDCMVALDASDGLWAVLTRPYSVRLMVCVCMLMRFPVGCDEAYTACGGVLNPVRWHIRALIAAAVAGWV